jgi:uncharacterized protein YkwD
MKKEEAPTQPPKEQTPPPEKKPEVKINLGGEGTDPMPKADDKQANNNPPSTPPTIALKDQLAITTNNAINQYRNQYRKPLVWDQKLADDAYEWSKRMAQFNSLDHDEGKNFGENILYTYGSLIRSKMGSESPEAIGKYFENQWENSEDHRINILRNYKTTGIGIYIQKLPNGDRKYWATQRFRF